MHESALIFQKNFQYIKTFVAFYKELNVTQVKFRIWMITDFQFFEALLLRSWVWWFKGAHKIIQHNWRVSTYNMIEEAY